MLFLLVNSSLWDYGNKLSFFCKSGNSTQVKEGFCGTSASMKYKNKRPCFIRCAAGRHIFIPGTHDAVHLLFPFHCPAGNRVFEITQTLSALSSVTTCQANILPCLFYVLHGKIFCSNCNPDLRNILFIHLTADPDRSRSPDFICPTSGQCDSGHVILLFPVCDCRTILPAVSF